MSLQRRHAQRIRRGGLLRGAGLRAADVITAAAGGRGVVAVVLIVERLVIGFQPVRLFHLGPGVVRLQPEVEHPFRFITLGGDGTDHILIDAGGQLVGHQLGKETFLVFAALTDPSLYVLRNFYIASCHVGVT